MTIPAIGLEAAARLCDEEATKWRAKGALDAAAAVEASAARIRSCVVGGVPFDAVKEAKELWVSITARGPSLWFEYDHQSIGILADALRSVHQQRPSTVGARETVALVRELFELHGPERALDAIRRLEKELGNGPG